MSGLLSDFLAFDAESVKVSEHDVRVRGEGAGGARGEPVALAGAGDQVGVAQRVAAAQEVLRDRVRQTPARSPGHHLHTPQYAKKYHKYVNHSFLQWIGGSMIL